MPVKLYHLQNLENAAIFDNFIVKQRLALFLNFLYDTFMEEKCPKCGSPLGPITETATGRKLQRCSTGSWNKDTKKTEGCDYVKWLTVEPKELDEKCPKCGSPVVLVVTRFGKKMKKCSTNTW